MKRFGAFAVILLCLSGAARAAADQVARGGYLIRAAGCIGCHTDVKGGGIPLAGGRGLKTPFGIFYSPNITPHPETGIGEWSDQNFLDALRHGRRPDGGNYFPVFPYPSYTAMRAERLAREERAPKVGDKAPDFSLERLSAEGKRTGEMVSLRRHFASGDGPGHDRPVGLVFGSYT